MKRNLIWLILGAAIVCCIAAVVMQSTSTRVLYASQMGCALNSDVYNGGGTDDSVPLQAALNLATGKGYEFIVDGPALVSTSIVVHSNTKLKFLPGAGLFMAPHANWPVLVNDLNTNYTSTNIVIEGGILNCNGNNQSEYQTNGFRFSGAPGVWGVWFAGVDGLIMRDTKVINAKAYTWLFNDSRNVLMENCWAYYTNNTIQTNTLYGNDGVHLMCNMQNFTSRNFRQTAGSDDTFAIMTDETDFTLQVQDPRWTTNSGSMSNIVFDGVYVENGKNVGKLQTYGSTNARLDYVTIKNVRGQASTQGFVGSAPISGKDFEIDGFDVEMGGSADTFSLPYITVSGLISDTIRINNVRIIDRQGTGLGSSGLIQLGQTATNYLLSNIYVEGGPVTGVGNGGSVAADDVAIAWASAPGHTNVPSLTINGLQAKTLAGMISTGDGSGNNYPNGIIRYSGVVLGPGVKINDGTFTNISCIVSTNNPTDGQVVTATGTSGAVAWTSAGTATITYTNLISGLVYHNLSGRPQSIAQGIVLNVFNQVGKAEMSFYVDPANGTAWPKTNRMGQVCTASSITAAQQAILVAFIPAGASYVLTNTSTGVSNSATPDANQTGQLITY